MTKQELFQNILRKRSFLCIGLDTDIQKIPRHLLKASDPIFEFNKQIIDATHDLCVAYKPNTAFYESMGAAGWEALEATTHYLKEKHNDIFTIADAKRGDIGNTSHMYARSFFGLMDYDAITVAPYMGEDSVKPFLEYEGKWAIVLALTSNKGAEDFQQLHIVSSPKQREKISAFLFEKVLKVSRHWGSEENMM
ncbi:MAG TPA: orotidine-5'-phosphate decarboxylase, partial [Bacteroidia bacterium]